MYRTVTIAAAAFLATLTLAGAAAQAHPECGPYRHRGWCGEREVWVPRYYGVRPVYVAPPPVYYAPPPVYYAPPPVYYAPPALGLSLNVPGVALGVSVPLH